MAFVMTNGTNILNRWQLLSPYLDTAAADLLGGGRDLGDWSRWLPTVGRCNRHCRFDDIGPGTQNETD